MIQCTRMPFVVRNGRFWRVSVSSGTMVSPADWKPAILGGAYSRIRHLFHCEKPEYVLEISLALKDIVLPAKDVFLCRSVLSQDLMKVSGLLASGKGGSGEELTRESRLELMGSSNRLQLTLIALGMDSAHIGSIVEDFSRISE